MSNDDEFEMQVDAIVAQRLARHARWS